MAPSNPVHWLRSALTLAAICLLAGGLVGLCHELGHYLPALALGWEPFISFAHGGFVDFRAAPEAPPAAHEVITLAGGPLMTFCLAGACALTLRRWPMSRALVIFGLWNAVFRLSVLMDGAGADEAKISALLGVPYLTQGLSVVVSAALGWQVLRAQSWFRGRIWHVPLAFVPFAISYICSLKLLAALFG